MEKHTGKVIPTLDHPSDDIKVRAAETQNPETLPKTPETPAKDLSRLSEAYKEFAPIFTKPVAGQLPPHRP
jgi:hypothetical protein